MHTSLPKFPLKSTTPIMNVELNLLIYKIDLFDIAGTNVDIYPNSVENITISNVDILKIMTTVSYVYTIWYILTQYF